MVLKDVILDPQGAFVAGCQILDGVLIANECVDELMRSRK